MGCHRDQSLRPLLFILYINDLPQILQGVNFVLYADDTNILVVDKEEETLQQKVTLVMQWLELWFKKNDLIVNIDKTCAISFHANQRKYFTRPCIKFHEKEITYNSEIKFLGLNITENLAWQAHIDTVGASLSQIYYMIKYLRNATSTQMLWSIYFAYFQSKLRYGIIFWGREGKTVQIFRLQKKVIRLIAGAKKCESCKPLFRELQILTLASMYILEVLCFTKKYQGYIWQNMDIHNHNTRRKLDLHTHHCNTALYQRSVTNMGIKLFNKLPTQIKQLPSYKIFKREVKNLL